MSAEFANSYVLFLSLDQFYVRHFAEAGDRIVRAVNRGRWIIDATDAARHLGVMPGTPLIRARTYLAGHGLIHEWQDALGADAQQAWLDVAARHCGVIEPCDQHAAWLDLSAHPNPMWVAERVVEDIAAVSGLTVRFGSARTKWLAKKSAEIEGTHLAPMTPEELGLLSVHELTPIDEEARERLVFLGCRRIREIPELSLTVLTKNFGPQAMMIIQAAKGGLVEEVRPLYPNDVIRECVLLDGAAEEAAVIDAAFQRLAMALGERLGRSGQAAMRLTAEIEFEEEICIAERTFRKPVHDAHSVLNALRRDVMPSVTRPVLALRVTLRELQVAQLVQQHLENARSSPRSRQDRAEVALRQVSSAFGNHAIARASELEEPYRVRVLKAWSNALGWR